MDFESLCCDMAKEIYGDFNAQKYGRRGQKQWGIDIKATDRKNNDERVVIQCKYKYDPSKISLNKKKEEILEELTTALSKHTFECFIYAANIDNDSVLQSYCEELSEKNGVEVKIWSQEDVESVIRFYSRLQRIYTESGAKDDIQLIDNNFINALDHDQAELKERSPNVQKTNLFRFYSGAVAQSTQWKGILENLDAPRQAKIAIDKRIKELFHKPFLDNRVAIVVYGEGGVGKSTLLRRIALDNVRKENYTNWWVENINKFVEFDAYSIADNRNLLHLIFIDDWYRNQPEDKGKKFFRWLRDQSNVLVLIGDRKISPHYKEHCYDGFAFNLSPSENKVILSHIAGVSTPLGNIINEIQSNEYLLDNISISVILFVISHLYEEQNNPNAFDLKDGVAITFKKIIARKLLKLEEDKRYKGLGKALYLLGVIYGEPKLNYAVFPENFFLQSAAFFGNNPSLIDRISSNKCYPEEVNALVYKREAVAKNGKIYNSIHFNHDVLAEQGIAAAGDIYAQLEYKLDLFEQKSLLQHLINKSDTTSCLVLWMWLQHTKQFDASYKWLWLILEMGVDEISGWLFYSVLQLLSFEEKRNICTNILSQKDFFKLPKEIVTTAIRILKKEEEGKKAALTILSQKDFFKLPKEIVTTAIRILEKEEDGKKAAISILSQKDFFKLPADIVSTAIRILGKEEGKKAAITILSQKDFFKLPHQIVTTVIRILEKEEGKKAAITILSQKDFFKLPFEIVSTAIRILEKEEEAKKAAKTILSQKDFFKLPAEIVSTAIRILEKEEEAKKAAKTILSQKDFFKLPAEIVSTAIRILEKEEEAKKAAKTILSQKDFFKLPAEIVSTAIRILEKEEEAKKAAKTILSQKDFFKLPADIVTTAIRILEKEEEGKKAAKTILENRNRVHTFMVFRAIGALAISKEAMHFKTIKAILEEMASSKSNFSKGQWRLFYDLLYLPLVNHPIHEKRVYKVAKSYHPKLYRNGKFNVYQVLKCFTDYPDNNRLRKEINQLKKNILRNCIEDLEYQYIHNPRKIIIAHIKLSLNGLKELALINTAIIALLDYGERKPDFKNSDFYKWLKTGFDVKT